MRQGVLVVFVCLAAGWCFAQGPPAADPSTLNSPGQAEALAESAMEQFVAGEYEAAFELLKPHWPMPDTEIDMLVLQTVKQRGMAEGRFGKSLGFERVRSESLSESLFRVTYLEKLEKTALRWRFLFYRARDSWSVNTVVWDDQLINMCGHDS